MSEQAEAVIYVVDDDASMRAALTRLLVASGYAVRCYASAGDFLVAEPDSRPGCLLVDLELGGPGGLELQQALIRQRSTMPVVFMSAYHDVPRTVMAIKAGAIDFLLKPLDRQALLATLESALAARATSVVDRQLRDTVSLSEREQVVLRGIVAGRLNKQIAADLGLSERTIKSCRAEVMRKLDARSLAELVRRGEPLLRH
ncbi:response regulator transcription factor [Paraburkholderia panacisoli]|uniref:Response regulator transcription factor n=1 Tax=Paraburkholderia panacisoli TaxID=2603818 RepID=A0A5B0GCX2_9BURK|nr:response regulator [Paraburkholderia panacisoli]KAA1000541.1 response regulator transcription factor [Paraburkholderia panacisoli]